jgi:hypothetical protein
MGDEAIQRTSSAKRHWMATSAAGLLAMTGG